MSKLQGIVLILAAFGIISIVLSQTGYGGLGNKAETRPVANIHINSHDQQVGVIKGTQSSASTKLDDNAPLPDKTQYVNNIYQSGSGSFYFYHKNALPAGLNSLENDDASLQQYISAKLSSTQADIKITGPIARTRLTQVFTNPSNTVSSGVYVFPLPQDASVDQLLMTIGERKIEGVIKPKELAKKMFVEAQFSGKRASLVSQIRPNMFTNHIANIPPNSSITVSIEYQQFIKQERHHYTLRLPLSITPRYTPKAQTPETSTNNISVLGNTQINVSLNAGLPLTGITSEHHPIQTSNPYSTEYQIYLDTNTPVNKDFVLHWQMKPSQLIQASHFTYHNDEYLYGLISLMPPELDEIEVKRNLVFILDVSGSMVGESLIQAKQALAFAIQDLQDSDYFNLITFSSEADKLWHTSERASQAFKDEALQYLFDIEANGGTEIDKALKLAFAQPSVVVPNEHVLNQIVFITDGSVSNENELMQTIHHGLGDYRMFTVGIGSAPNAYFMHEAATAGRGSYTFIGDVSHVKTKMNGLLNKLKRPALSNINLNIKDGNEAFGFEVYPSILPDLYADTPLIITYRRKLAEVNTALNNAMPFTIEGDYLTETVNAGKQLRKWTSSLPATTAAQERGIHKYWARMKIKALHQQLNMKAKHSEGYSILKSNIEAAITQVALAHQLVSEFTSLIAIDHIEEAALEAMQSDLAFEKAQGKTQQKIAAQYRIASLPSTATPAGIFSLIGAVLLILGTLMHARTRTKHA